jgi:hypothetical protein
MHFLKSDTFLTTSFSPLRAVAVFIPCFGEGIFLFLDLLLLKLAQVSFYFLQWKILTNTGLLTKDE